MNDIENIVLAPLVVSRRLIACDEPAILSGNLSFESIFPLVGVFSESLFLTLLTPCTIMGARNCLAVPSGRYLANVSEGTLVTGGVGNRRENYRLINLRLTVNHLRKG